MSAIISEEDLERQMRLWHSLRDMVVKGEMTFSIEKAAYFSPQVLRIIRDDLYIAWQDNESKVEEIDFILKIMGTENKYAKTNEFEDIRQITFLALERLDGKAVGAKYVDKQGYINRLTFKDEQGNEKLFETSSYGFYVEWKRAGLVSGEECLAVSVLLKDPYKDMSYRHWVIQKIAKTISALITDLEAKEVM